MRENLPQIPIYLPSLNAEKNIILLRPLIWQCGFFLAMGWALEFWPQDVGDGYCWWWGLSFEDCETSTTVPWIKYFVSCIFFPPFPYCPFPFWSLSSLKRNVCANINWGNLYAHIHCVWPSCDCFFFHNSHVPLFVSGYRLCFIKW